jgi:hypothetical protein
MMYRLTKHRGGDDNVVRFPGFAIGDANFVEIEHQFGYTALYVVAQILNYSLQKRCPYLRAMRFFSATFCRDYLIRMSKNEAI